MCDLQPKACLKGRLPFRLGTTSYIVPDDILPNLHYLRDQVDDVELVLFESDEFSNMPSARDVARMAELAADHALSYTVHLPLDTHLGSADERERQASVGKCLRVIERMASLNPFAYVLHLHGDRRGDPPTDDRPRWLAQCRRSLAELLGHALPASQLCVENIDYDFALVAELVEQYDLAVCIDIGHLLLMQRDVEAHLKRWLHRARIIHLHGVHGGYDHVDISHVPPHLLDLLTTCLALDAAMGRRVVTLEIFDEDDFLRSMDVLQERLGTWLRSR
jgi:sugar phosphate isomerase/epimerase